MKVAFTLCSNNYLAHAKVLADSFTAHNPAYKFVIGLVDRRSPAIDYSVFNAYTIITIEEAGIENIPGLWEKFDIIELNTSVKPSFFKYLGKTYQGAEYLIYLDPDIMFFESFAKMEGLLERSSIVLTPHVLQPVPVDNLTPSESTFLNYGIYNLGFAAVNFQSPVAAAFLDWWEERCLKLGFNRPWEGLFVDQLWINFAPVYFEKVSIIKGHGYNMGPWNMHERAVEKIENNKVILSSGEELVFFHFSNYSYKKPEQISRLYNRVSFNGNPVLKELYDKYRGLLLQNNIASVEQVRCYFMEEKDKLAQLKNKKSTGKKALLFSKNLLLNITPLFIVNYYRKSKKPLTGSHAVA